MKNYLLGTATLLSVFALQAQSKLEMHIPHALKKQEINTQNNFNPNYQLDSIHVSYHDFNGWSLEEETHYTYQNNLEASRVELDRRISNYQQFLNTYDANGNLTQVIVNIKGSAQSPWVYDRTYTHTYNTDNLIVSTVVTPQSGNGEKIEYFYAGGNLIQQKIFRIVNQTHTETTRLEHKHNQDGNVTESLILGVLNSSTVLDSLHKGTFEYDPFMNNISTITSKYDLNTQSWIKENKTDKVFNQDHQVITENGYVWNVSTQAWERSSKTSFGYDNYNLLDAKTSYLWDDNSNNWSTNGNYQYSYDQNQLIHTEKRFNLQASSNATMIKEYFRSSIVSSTNDVLNDEKWSVFPSPASHQIQVGIPENQQVKKFRIFDMNGRLVTSNKLNNGNSIHISNFVPGQYIIQVVTNETIKTMTFIKQ